MPACPNCRSEIRIAELPHPRLFASYRVCPHCGQTFTVDLETKRRQAVAIAVAALSLVLTLLLYFEGNQWLVPAVISYSILAGLIYWGNKRVVFVPHDSSGRGA